MASFKGWVTGANTPGTTKRMKTTVGPPVEIELRTAKIIIGTSAIAA